MERGYHSTARSAQSQGRQKAPEVGFVLRTMFGCIRRQREAFDEAEQAKGDEAEGARHADPVKNAVHAATSDDWSRGMGNRFTDGANARHGPARFPAS